MIGTFEIRMKNVTEVYWNDKHLIVPNEPTIYNVTEEPVLIYNLSSNYNCCQSIISVSEIEPTFIKYLTALQHDRLSLLLLLFLFSFSTIFGNSLVISAVIRERYLHTPTNYFVMSLAVADFLVGLVVMPFSALYEVLNNTWFFGTDFCDIWRSLDVFCSTASILNLCVISMDRYLAITDPISYPMRMTRNRAFGLITAVWICSCTISFPAILWWRAVREGPMPPFKCTFTEHLGYLLFSSTISFYIPLLIMVITYYHIYHAAMIQTRSLKLGTKHILMPSGELQLTLRIHRGGTTRQRERRCQHQHITHSLSEDHDHNLLQNNGLDDEHQNLGKKISFSRKFSKFAKEKKAAKTLGIVMGVFIICWLPFFVVNLLTGLCVDCIAYEEIVSAVVTWLGWINSSMNPVIYACWSRDFRRAFIRILCVGCPRNVRKKYQPSMRSKSSRANNRIKMKFYS